MEEVRAAEQETLRFAVESITQPFLDVAVKRFGDLTDDRLGKLKDDLEAISEKCDELSTSIDLAKRETSKVGSRLDAVQVKLSGQMAAQVTAITQDRRGGHEELVGLLGERFDTTGSEVASLRTQAGAQQVENSASLANLLATLESSTKRLESLDTEAARRTKALLILLSANIVMLVVALSLLVLR